MWIPGNGGKIGDTKYNYNWGEIGHHSGEGHWDLGGYIWGAGELAMGLEAIGHCGWVS